MAVSIWGMWSPQWTDNSKVEFDGLNKYIIVHPEVTTLDIRSEVYTAWVNWVSFTGVDNKKWVPAMRYSGLDPIPGGESGGIFFLINGWKLLIDFNKVAVNGVLYSEDFNTAYWSSLGLPLYPATVSALVSSAIIYQNVITGDLNSVPAAVWGYIPPTTPVSGSMADIIKNKLLSVAKFLGLK
jgi:hypothetical protein